MRPRLKVDVAAARRFILRGLDEGSSLSNRQERQLLTDHGKAKSKSNVKEPAPEPKQELEKQNASKKEKRAPNKPTATLYKSLQENRIEMILQIDTYDIIRYNRILRYLDSIALRRRAVIAAHRSGATESAAHYSAKMAQQQQLSDEDSKWEQTGSSFDRPVSAPPQLQHPSFFLAANDSPYQARWGFGNASDPWMPLRSPVEFPRTSSPMFNPNAPADANALPSRQFFPPNLESRRYSLDQQVGDNPDFAPFRRVASSNGIDSLRPQFMGLGLRDIDPIASLRSATPTTTRIMNNTTLSYPLPRSNPISPSVANPSTKVVGKILVDSKPNWDSQEHWADQQSNLVSNLETSSGNEPESAPELLTERSTSSNGRSNSGGKNNAQSNRKQKKNATPSATQPGSPESSSPRSELLQDLRTNKSGAFAGNVKIEDVIAKGLVNEFATDQNGSRFIQQSLETSNAEQKQAIFEQLEPTCLRLCVDVFGNYVIQKFFEFGLPVHRRILAEKLGGNVLTLSLQMYGCRVIQKALEVINEDQQVLLVRELEGHVIKCVKDQNGNHVVQKCIEKVPPQHVQFIVHSFKGHIFSLSTHAYGCRVIQRLLEYCTDQQKSAILEELFQRIPDLVTDQYGNYVIQHVLQKGAIEYRSAILLQVKNNVMEMSKHKFASNVIEKCFAYATNDEKGLLIDEIIGSEESSPLPDMVKDQYGNYVIQKVLGSVNEYDRDRLIDAIRNRVPGIRKIAYGRHICSKVEKLTGRAL